MESEKKLRLIWDFYGPDALPTAKHHEIHLKDFILRDKLANNITGYEEVDNLYAVAWMVVNQSEIIPVRDVLKPHRGEWYVEDENQ
jgi:hypothetical protein